MSNAAAHARLSLLARRIGSLAGLSGEASREAAQPLKELVKAEFPPGVDAYGVGWKPLKPITIRKGRSNPPLTNTGAAKNSIEAVATGEGNGAAIRITILEYMKYHLSTGRAVFPKPGKAPESWRIAVALAHRRAFERRMKG